MATTTPSLFGMLGDEEALQRQLDEQRAAKFAEQTQEQRLASMGYRAGAGLGRGIAGAFGVDVTDPIIKQASQIRGLASQFDTTTVDGLRKFAVAIKDINPNMAVQISQAADEKAKTQAEAASKEVETKAKQQDITGKESRVKMLVNTANMSPEEASALASSDTAFANYVKGKKVETPADYAVQAVKLGYGSKGYLSEYTPEQMKKMEEGLTAQKAAIATAGRATTVFQQETQVMKDLGAMDVKRVGEAIKMADSAAGTLRSLEKLSNLDNQQLISGAFATGRVGATNLLASLGLASQSDINMLASSQNYQKVAGDVILNTLGGKLGAGFSDADREFIKGLVPQLETSPLARKQLIAFMQEKQTDIINEAARMDSYLRKNKSLEGFRVKIPLSASTPTNRYSNLTDEELDARIKAARAGKQ